MSLPSGTWLLFAQVGGQVRVNQRPLVNVTCSVVNGPRVGQASTVVPGTPGVGTFGAFDMLIPLAGASGSVSVGCITDQGVAVQAGVGFFTLPIAGVNNQFLALDPGNATGARGRRR